ncbi:hypothetical protein AB6A40_007850 [Gnathostoma spinigerum]|uniref:Uncharacterized protein n=1 Tax=Gnathostoma spinigerum TaxID=75299 RepID=A0ABD6EMY4_9BILA
MITGNSGLLIISHLSLILIFRFDSALLYCTLLSYPFNLVSWKLSLEETDCIELNIEVSSLANEGNAQDSHFTCLVDVNSPADFPRYISTSASLKLHSCENWNPENHFDTNLHLILNL